MWFDDRLSISPDPLDWPNAKICVYINLCFCAFMKRVMTFTFCSLTDVLSILFLFVLVASGVKVGVNDFIIKAAAVALQVCTRNLNVVHFLNHDHFELTMRCHHSFIRKFI